MVDNKMNKTINNPHYLDQLLKPESIALVGVSPRPGTVGNDMLKVLLDGGYDGKLYLVNPKYDQIEGFQCFKSLSDIPESIDMAVLSVSGNHMEALFEEAIRCKVGGITIYDLCKLEQDTSPCLLERLKARAAEEGIPVCGGNCMGYYNFEARTMVSFQSPGSRKPGHISLIAHSGSIFVLPTANDPRFRFNLVVSAGQEISTTLDQYMDFALEQASTRVLAIFMEAIRNPEGFVEVLEKAQRKGIPVVVTKVGRTEASARLAATHSGAIAGDNTAYEALFKKYGVICTDSLDDLLTTSLLLSEGQGIDKGGLGYISDSGGLRELFVDIADKHQVPFAQISDATTQKLSDRLPLGLDPVNPLDAAGSFTPDYANVFRDCIRILMDDPQVAIGLFEFEARDDFIYMPELIEVAKETRRHCNKPFMVINTFGSALNTAIAEDLLDHGIPLINGVENAVKAVANILHFRDQQYRTTDRVQRLNPEAAEVERWRARLGSGEPLSEAEGLSLLADFGIPAALAEETDSLTDTLLAADRAGFPVVLKTAEPGIHHKSDVGGVKLNLQSRSDVEFAYQDLATRLGARVTVEPMAAGGVELALGIVNDPQFGPLVMVGSGGIYIEVLKDRCFSLAPFDVAEAERMINQLQIRPLLEGVRGQAAVDLPQLAATLSRFSLMADALSDVIAEVDVNPLIVKADGCIAVDALVLGKPAS